MEEVNKVFGLEVKESVVRGEVLAHWIPLLDLQILFSKKGQVWEHTDRDRCHGRRIFGRFSSF